MSTNTTRSSTYKKKTLLEHVLLRAETYVGSKEPESMTLYIPEKTDSSIQMISKEITFVPAFYKIFDEIIVNAADNKVRDDSTDTIKVTIDRDKGEISVWNNGKGIPVVIHEEEKIYVPEMIFGHLLTGSNYDDDEKRVTGGRNGYGSKLTNIYSTEFTVETHDTIEGKTYKQRWTNNMTKCYPAKITKCSSKKSDYTKVTFTPDLAKLNMQSIDDDTLCILRKRVYDLTGSLSGVKVFLNGERIHIKNFKDYISTYLVNESEDKPRIVHDRINDRWEIAVALSDTGGFQQVSFVNNISTTKGGTHVAYITDQIVAYVKEHLEKKGSGILVKPAQIKNQLFVFVNCLIENPAFEGQVKETMTLRPNKYGSTCILSDAFLKKVGKLGIIERTLELIHEKDTEKLKKTDGTKRSRLSGIIKLNDANDAGTRKSKDCTLFLVEGDSVTGDTPLLLKDVNNRIHIKSIENLTSTFWLQGSREFGRCTHEVWSDKGWTKIHYIMRHKVNKAMYRVVTPSACIDVTEDHSLLRDDSTEISPANCKIGDKLLHVYPHMTDFNEVSTNCRFFLNLTADEAWVMGLFWSSAYLKPLRKKRRHAVTRRRKMFTYVWGMLSHDLSILKRVQSIMSKIYKASFVIKRRVIKNKKIYKLELLHQDGTKWSRKTNLLNRGLCRLIFIYKEFSSKQRDNKHIERDNKHIPSWLLNTSLENRKMFMKGIYTNISTCMDDLTSGSFKLTVYDKTEAATLFCLAKSINHQCLVDTKINGDDDTKINGDDDQSRVILEFFVNTGESMDIVNLADMNVIKQIIPLGMTNDYVYDIETNNHHFQAGVGQMIVHNSALSFALSGIPVVEHGRDKYGAFPLRGKLLNVREASTKQKLENTEIAQLKQILGLKEDLGKSYTSVDSLRYGHICCLVDSDVDGKHIKGLILNWLESSFPSLLKIPGFVLDFKSPIVKCSRNGKDILFYTLRDYEEWKKNNNDGKSWTITYFKGLATSEEKDVKRYFRSLDHHLKTFAPLRKEDSEKIDLAFSKKRPDDRKQWLQRYSKDIFLDDTLKEITISDFIDKDFIEFSMYDNIRSIPSVIDGLKPGQRKILYTAFKSNLNNKIKVSQLSGKVSETTEYRHGEQSLNMTIVGMAQWFVGANNISLLYPSGGFGSRRQGGADAGSPRYIYTYLQRITRTIFPEKDDPVLDYQLEDGFVIEPNYYVPVLPMVLINGADGIGTGYSTSVLSYNPKDLVDILMRRTSGNIVYTDLKPWYRGFVGDIYQSDPGKWTFTGKIKKTSDTMLEITELPIHTWTEKYKEFLEKLIVEESIKDYKEYHTNTSVRFVITTTVDKMKSFLAGDKNENENLLKNLKLITTKNSTNMMLFDSKEKLRKYETVGDIIEEFYQTRIEYYEKRKHYQLEKLKHDLQILQNKVRFIEGIISGQVIINQKKKKEIDDMLHAQNYQTFEDGTFTYLTSMPLHSLQEEKLTQLKTDMVKSDNEYKNLLKTSLEELYRKDLNDTMEALDLYAKIWIDAQSDELDDETDHNSKRKRKQLVAKIEKKSRNVR